MSIGSTPGSKSTVLPTRVRAFQRQPLRFCKNSDARKPHTTQCTHLVAGQHPAASSWFWSVWTGSLLAAPASCRPSGSYRAPIPKSCRSANHPVPAVRRHIAPMTASDPIAGISE